MTAKSPSVAGDLTPAEQTRRRAKTGLVPEPGGWLTTILRPAGRLDQPILRRLGETLSALAASSDMVIVDVTAVDGGNPRALARSLRAPALRFERAGHCLLLTGASAALAAELDRLDVPIVTLAANAVPFPAA